MKATMLVEDVIVFTFQELDYACPGGNARQSEDSNPGSFIDSMLVLVPMLVKVKMVI